MQIQNYQQTAWRRLFTDKVDSLAEQASFTYAKDATDVNESILVTFEVPEETKREFLDVLDASSDNMNSFAPFNVNITVKSGMNSATKPLTLLELPRLVNGNLLINGCRWSLINTLHPASGWYLERIKGMTALTLHRGAQKILTVQPKLSRNSKDYIFDVKIYRNDKTYTVSLKDFLFALSGNPDNTNSSLFTYGLEDCIIFRKTFLSTSSSASLADISAQLLRILRNKSDAYVPLDAVNELQAFFSKNMFNIGEEKIPRFKKFTSFSRAIGSKLATAIQFNSEYKPFVVSQNKFMQNAVITPEMARELDNMNLQKLEIITPRNEHLTLKKVNSISDSLTLDEFCCALHVLDQAYRGIGTVDDVDDACNKVMYSIREQFSSYIEKAFYKCASGIKSRIDNNKGDIIYAALSNLKTIFDSKAIAKNIVGSSCYQQIDETNSLAHFDQSYRITSTAKTVTDRARDIHPLQYGRICPYTTSESKQVGLNLDMTLGCDIDEYGFCTTPVYVVGVNKDGTRYKGQQIQLSAVDEVNTIIAPADTDLTADLDTIIPGCRIDGEFTEMPLRDVTHIMSNNLQTVGPLIASVPAQNMDAGKRSVMSVSAQRQALTLWRCERPNVTTGLDSVCDIGIQRAYEVIQDFIYSEPVALRIFKEHNEILSEDLLLYVTKQKTVNGCLIVTFAVSLYGSDFTWNIKQKPPAATMKGSLKYVRLSTPKISGSKRYYGLNDIVFYNNDICIGNTDSNPFSRDHFNFGGSANNISIEEAKQHGVAIGANVNVMFKSMNGYTYEDSIVVNEDFLARQGLAIIKTHTISYDISAEKEIDTNYNTTHIFKGLPKQGIYVQAGQEVLAVHSIDKVNKHGSSLNSEVYTLAVGKQGYVLSCNLRTGKNGITTVEIHLGDILPIGIGDKLTGLHGNKGVIGRIMKSYEMPFTADGQVPDIILNPLGILARLNGGQIVEYTLGAISQVTGKMQILEPFSSDTNIDSIAQKAQELGLVEQDVYSGSTGLKLDKKAFIGNMYMLRVEHTSTSKYNATGDCSNMISKRTNQPLRGSGGAQRISELGTWCLLAMDATDLLNSFFSVQSDSSSKEIFDRHVENGEPTLTDEIQNNNLDRIRAYFYMLGLDLSISCNVDGNETSLKFLTRNSLDNRASGKVVIPSSSITAAQALGDRIFGDQHTNDRDLVNHYGKLSFGTKIIMPTLLHTNKLTQLIKAIIYQKEDGELTYDIRYISRNIFSSLISPNKKHFELWGWSEEIVKDSKRVEQLAQLGVDIPNSMDTMRLPVFVSITKDEISCDDIQIAIDSEFKTGIEAAVEVFEKYNLYTSLFDTVFISDVAVSGKQEVEIISDNAMHEDTVSLADSVITSVDADEVEATFAERTALDKEQDAAIDDDIETHFTEIEVDSAEMKEDSAEIEAIIPSFRAIVMMIKNYSIGNTARGNVLKNFVVDGMLIPPAKFRPTVPGDVTKNNPIDVCLNAIYNAASSLNREKSSPTNLYNVIKTQLITGKDKRAPSLMSQITDHGAGISLLRDTNLSKRVTYSGRSVISIGRDLEFGKCGIPVCMLTTIFMRKLIKRIRWDSSPWKVKNLSNSDKQRALTCLSNKNITGFRQVLNAKVSVQLFNACYSNLVDKLKEILKDQPCILNREPSLHKFSLQGFDVVPVDGYTIQLHPLNCHGFNADYDGDQMAVYFPMHDKGRQDTEEKLMTRRNLIDPKDGSGIVAINQDMILGLYYATIHKDNEPDRKDYYSTISLADIRKSYSLPTYGKDCFFASPKGKSFGVAEKIAEDIFAGVIGVHDLCYCIYNGCEYIAEAGRLLVNAILPGGLGFPSGSKFSCLLKDPISGMTTTKKIYSLKIKDILTKKTIKSVIDLGIEYFMQFDFDTDNNHDHLADFFNRLMHLGFLMADISGISLSLQDFKRLPVKDLINKTVNATESKIIMLDEWYKLGFCSEQERDDAAKRSWSRSVSDCKDLIKKEFVNASNNEAEVNRFNRNSNIYMIIDSGARGDVGQLLEMSGMIGVVHNASHQQLKSPIVESYMDGLSPMDFASNAYTARRQIVATQLTTADSGAYARDLIYLAEHLHIRNDNYCCKNDKDTKDTYNHFLTVPCQYTASYDKDILWFYGKEPQNTESVEVVTSKEFLHSILAKVSDISKYQPNMINWEERRAYLYQDLRAVADNAAAEIDYDEFIARLNLKNGKISDVALAESMRQPYCYVMYRNIDGDISVGIRLYVLKLTQLTRDMLKWRVAYTGNDKHLADTLSAAHSHNCKYVQADDLEECEVKEDVLGDEDIVLDEDAINLIEDSHISEVSIYSMLNCTSTAGICRKCFGITYDTFKLPRPNSLVGYGSIQAIANPMTQLILDSHKSDYSNDESAMSKIKRVTTQKHSAKMYTPIDTDLVAYNKDNDNSDKVISEYLGFVAGDKAVIALDALDNDKYEMTIYELWKKDEGDFIRMSKTRVSLQDLRVMPTIFNGRVLSKHDPISEIDFSHGYDRGTAIATIADYSEYMGCAYTLADGNVNREALSELASKTRFEYWKTLCQCFTNDSILSRNFETFARALTEFGVAESTRLDKGIVKGYTYSTSLLKSAGVEYSPVIVERSLARRLSSKIFTDISFGYMLERATYFIVNGCIENPDTYIGKEVIGNTEGKFITNADGLLNIVKSTEDFSNEESMEYDFESGTEIEQREEDVEKTELLIDSETEDNMTRTSIFS